MGFRYEVPDYRYRQLEEVLNSFELPYPASEYKLKEHTQPDPDKELYFFLNNTDSHVLVFMAEDYIADLDYVRDCFQAEINADLITLHKVKADKVKKLFDERSAVKAADVYKQPDDWDKMSNYAVDFQPYYIGFMATVQPKSIATFWSELP